MSGNEHVRRPFQFRLRTLFAVFSAVILLAGGCYAVANAHVLWLRYFTDHEAILSACDKLFATHPFYANGAATGEEYHILRFDEGWPDAIRELQPTMVYFEKDHITLSFSGGFREDGPAVIIYRPGVSTKSPERLYIVP